MGGLNTGEGGKGGALGEGGEGGENHENSDRGDGEPVVSVSVTGPSSGTVVLSEPAALQGTA